MKFKTNVVVGENGEIVVQEDLLKKLKIKQGDKIIVLGDGDKGIAMKKDDAFLHKTLGMLAKYGLIKGRMDE